MDSLILRHGAMDDAENLHRWRNDPAIRAVSFTSDVIPWDQHITWLQNVLADPQRRILIGELSGDPIGVIRLDAREVPGDYEVSIYLVPGCSGRGFGTRLLIETTIWAQKHLANLTRILARIKSDNLASQGAFRKAGFRPLIHTDPDLMVWQPSYSNTITEEYFA